MNYDEDLLVELIACGDVSQVEIGERAGVSRRTVWRIANGHSRPDLQRKIADTVEGHRQATIRMAAKWMKSVLSRQIKVALEGDGETARKSREFLLKTFILAVPEQAAKAAAKPKPSPDAERQLHGLALYNSLMELSPDLKNQVIKELGGPADEKLSATPLSEPTEIEEASPSPSPLSSPIANCQGPIATPLVKQTPAPFANLVDGPYGKKVYAASIRAVEEAKEEAKANPPRRRVPRSPPA